MPKNEHTHSQKTLPAPPTAIPYPTPTMLPTPTVPPIAVAAAANGENPFVFLKEAPEKGLFSA